MRRIVQLTLVCLAGGVVSACKPDLIVATENIPTAGVRFINAVPDSAGAFGLDLRFVDIVESNAQYRITFRNSPPAAAPFVSTAIQYKGARAGSRHFKIFLDDTIQTIASTAVKDTTVTLAAGTNYTAILWGNGRSAATAADFLRLNFWSEDQGDPGVGKIALRVINATNAAIDAREYIQGGAAPATATWAAVPAYSASAYVIVDSSGIMYNIRAAGSATNMFADALALPGTPATCDNLACVGTQPPDIPATPGTKIAGSAVTAIVFPRSTAGARTPQGTAFTTPAISFMWDRRPPTGCDPKYC